MLRAGIRSPGGPRLDHCGRLQDGLHRARLTLGEWLRGKLNSKLRDELLNGEIFYSLREAQILIEGWRKHYNAVRPHSALGYRPPAPEAVPRPASPPPLRPAAGQGATIVYH